MPHSTYAAIMFAAGMCIPLMAALNAGLGRHLASPYAAAVILFCVGLISAVAVLAVTGPQALAKAGTAPRHLLIAGVLVAFYVVAITAIAPHFGVGNAVFFVLIGQLVSAALIDHFGLLGARQSPIDAQRAAGLALMGAGLALTQRAG